MNVTLGPEAQKLVEERLKRGGYDTAEAVILAGLASLKRDETYGDFAPGEWDELLAEAERSGEPLDAEQVFNEVRDSGRQPRTEAQR